MFFGKVHDVMGRDMRLLVTGGSKFDPLIGRDLYSLGFTILQAYGLTETSAAATINTPDEAHIDTVGRALPGMEIKIVDGEIADARSDRDAGLSQPSRRDRRGDARTAGSTPAISAAWTSSGRITITGRKKEMIVLASGKNIYPEEIEAHYRQSPFVKEICVMGLAEPGRPSSERLFGVVVPNMELLREKKIVNAGDIIRFEMEGLAAGAAGAQARAGLRHLVRAAAADDDAEDQAARGRAAACASVSAPRRRAGRSRSTPSDRAWMDEPHPAAVLAVIRGRD